MKIVCLGGSNGLKRVMKALELAGYEDVIGITGVHDSGGDTGKLREMMGIPPVGDIREIVAELTGIHELNYRVKNWHKIGNFFLALLAKKYGIEKASYIFGELLGLKFRILPIANSPTTLIAWTDKGLIEGEHLIENCGCCIKRLEIKPKISASPRIIREIKRADWVIFAPGSLYTSILSLLLYRGVRDAVLRAKNRLIVANLKVDSETPFIACLSEYIKEFQNFGIKDFFVIANSMPCNNMIKVDLIGENIYTFDLKGKEGHDIKKLSIALKKIIG